MNASDVVENQNKTSEGYALRYHDAAGLPHPVFTDERNKQLVALIAGEFVSIAEATTFFTDKFIDEAVAMLDAIRAKAPENIRGRLSLNVHTYRGRGNSSVWCSLQLQHEHDWPGRSFSYTVWPRPQQQNPFDNTGIEEVRKQASSLDAIFNGHLGNLGLSVQELISLVGLGQVVTYESLQRGCAKDQTRARVLVGDSVKWNKGKRTGVVKSLAKGEANIIDSTGKKCRASYSALTVCDKEENKLDLTGVPDDQLSVFQSVLDKAVLYRAKEEVMTVDRPFLSGKNTIVNARVFKCPNCGGPAVASKGYGEGIETTQCIMCGQYCILVGVTDGVGTMMVMPKPHRNQFCMSEAKCCANCGVFHFETGREGKRSTGYCRKTNQCVQAHSTCANDPHPGWTPRDPARYSKGMSQHCTNLGYGVADKRNTGRNDYTVEDLIYRAEDHEKERKRAAEAVRTYTVLFTWFQQQLVAKAAAIKVESMYGDTDSGKEEHSGTAGAADAAADAGA